MSGAWRVTFNMESSVNGGYNEAWLYINVHQHQETKHTTYSNNGVVTSTGGRVVTMELSAGDNITLRTTAMDEYYDRIHFCAEYIPNMSVREGNRNR